MKKKVLIFDDDVDIVEVCTAILQAKGFEVLGKNHCKNLLEDVIQYQPDVILMDNWLPDMGGVKAIQLLKDTEKTKYIPVIFFSANSSVEELAKEARADFILKKPFDLVALENVLKTATQLKATP